MADITRAEVASLIAEEYSGTLFESAIQGSSALSAFPRVNMGTKTNNIPVLATIPEADWVTDTDNSGVKPTSQATWANKTLVAEEVAVIIAIHENTVDDATEDILNEIAGLGGQAIGKKLDQAVFFDNDKPASWTSKALITAATDAGLVFETVDGPGSADDIYGAILQAAEAVGDQGYDPAALVAKSALRYKMANTRGTDGQPILMNNGLLGFDTTWNKNGAWDPAQATAFVVDPSMVRIGVRQDITVKFLDQATITGVGNLAEKDMVALRFKARFAYVLGTPATAELGSAGTPVAVVTPDTTS